MPPPNHILFLYKPKRPNRNLAEMPKRQINL